MCQSPDLVRTLYCGDNLHILRTCLVAKSVDLIYLDPPFYSQRAYQASFRKLSGGLHGSNQAHAFLDIWRWDAATEQAYMQLLASGSEPLHRTMNALRAILGEGSLLAYLLMMAVRLVELHRVLKSTGSVYLHCDPAASHYLKILMDVVFGAGFFRNEIVWGYKTGGASKAHFARKHDLIFFYSKSDTYHFNALKEKSYMMHSYGFKKSTFQRDARGEYTWVYMKDVWELPALGAADRQRLGYPTQKPEALLERIIQVSSREGDVVLDPFCGSGTTLAVAQRLGRGWIGIENHYLGLAYQQYRLAEAFPNISYSRIGAPRTLEEARALATQDPTQYRWWVLSLFRARPIGGDRRLRALEVGLAYGQLPASAGDLACFLVAVMVDEVEQGILHPLPAVVSAVAAPGLLIVTLDRVLGDVRTRCTHLASMAVVIQCLTVAELLSRMASVPTL